MRVFWTSDLHLGHANILVYTGRPWLKDGDLLEPFEARPKGDGPRRTVKPKWVSQEIAKQRAEKMTCRLIGEINMRCKEEDTLICVGDFCCYGNERGVEGLKIKAEEWENQIKPKLIHVTGNHDTNNSVKGCVYGMMCRVGHWNCWVCHYPPWNKKAMPAPPNCNAYICGHVHQEWDVTKHEGKPVVNVGVDVRNYRPVRNDELVEILRKAK